MTARSPLAGLEWGDGPFGHRRRSWMTIRTH
jgi:hypothetical protein